jgi:hypothetical protein
MTAANLAVFVGCTGTWRPEPGWKSNLTVRVNILDARKVWNRVDYLITPVAGTGQQWVSATTVTDLTTPEVQP